MLKHTRIHSFGYNSDWGERKASVLNVHDFAQALLGELHNSPQIRSSGNVSLALFSEDVSLYLPTMCQSPIVIISHSMGGLVSKKVQSRRAYTSLHVADPK